MDESEDSDAGAGRATQSLLTRARRDLGDRGFRLIEELEWRHPKRRYVILFMMIELAQWLALAMHPRYQWNTSSPIVQTLFSISDGVLLRQYTGSEPWLESLGVWLLTSVNCSALLLPVYARYGTGYKAVRRWVRRYVHLMLQVLHLPLLVLSTHTCRITTGMDSSTCFDAAHQQHSAWYVPLLWSQIVIFVLGMSSLRILLYDSVHTDPGPRSPYRIVPLAQAHGRVSALLLLSRCVIHILQDVWPNSLFGDYVAWAIFSAAVLIVWTLVMFQPYLYPFVNAVYSGIAAMYALAMLIASLTMLYPGASWPHLVMLIALLPVAVSTGVLSVWFFRTYSRRIHAADDKLGLLLTPMHAEVAVRSFVLEDSGSEPGNLEQANAIFEAAKERFPTSVWVLIHMASFMSLVDGNVQSTSAALARCSAMSTLPDTSWAVYRLEQHRRRSYARGSVGGSGERSLGLRQVIEHRKLLEQTVRLHTRAVKSIRRFWQSMLLEEIDFPQLLTISRSIHRDGSHAEAAYLRLLKEHPTCPTLQHYYAAFLDEVRNDPFRAEQHYQTAVQLERTQQLRESRRRRVLVKMKQRDVRNVTNRRAGGVGSGVGGGGGGGMGSIAAAAAAAAASKRSGIRGMPSTSGTDGNSSGSAVDKQRGHHNHHQHPGQVPLGPIVTDPSQIDPTDLMNERKLFFLVNSHSRITAASKSAVAVFGYNYPSDLVGKNMKIILPAIFADQHMAFVEMFQRNRGDNVVNKAGGNVVACQRADGTLFLMQMLVSVANTSSGSVFAAVFRALPETDGDPHVFVHRGTAMLIGCNAEAQDLIKMSSVEMQDKPCDRVFPSLNRGSRAGSAPATPAASLLSAQSSSFARLRSLKHTGAAAGLPARHPSAASLGMHSVASGGTSAASYGEEQDIFSGVIMATAVRSTKIAVLDNEAAEAQYDARVFPCTMGKVVVVALASSEAAKWRDERERARRRQRREARHTAVVSRGLSAIRSLDGSSSESDSSGSDGDGDTSDGDDGGASQSSSGRRRRRPQHRRGGYHAKQQQQLGELSDGHSSQTGSSLHKDRGYRGAAERRAKVVFKQLRARRAGTSSGLTQLRFVVLVVTGLLIAQAVASNRLFSWFLLDSAARSDAILLSSERSRLVTEAASQVLELHAVAGTGNATLAAIHRKELAYHAAELQTALTQLYQYETQVGTSFDPMLPLKRLVASGEASPDLDAGDLWNGTQVTTWTQLHESLVEFVIVCETLASEEDTPLPVLQHYTSDNKVFFVLANAIGPLRDAIQQATMFLHVQSSQPLVQIEQTSGTGLVLLVWVVAALTWFSLRPTVELVSREKRAAVAVFLDIDGDTLLQLAQQQSSLEYDGDSDEGDPDGEGDGAGGDSDDDDDVASIMAEHAAGAPIRLAERNVVNVESSAGVRLRYNGIALLFLCVMLVLFLTHLAVVPVSVSLTDNLAGASGRANQLSMLALRARSVLHGVHQELGEAQARLRGAAFALEQHHQHLLFGQDITDASEDAGSAAVHGASTSTRVGVHRHVHAETGLAVQVPSLAGVAQHDEQQNALHFASVCQAVNCTAAERGDFVGKRGMHAMMIRLQRAAAGIAGTPTARKQDRDSWAAWQVLEQHTTPGTLMARAVDASTRAMHQRLVSSLRQAVDEQLNVLWVALAVLVVGYYTVYRPMVGVLVSETQSIQSMLTLLPLTSLLLDRRLMRRVMRFGSSTDTGRALSVDEYRRIWCKHHVRSNAGGSASASATTGSRRASTAKLPAGSGTVAGSGNDATTAGNPGERPVVPARPSAPPRLAKHKLQKQRLQRQQRQWAWLRRLHHLVRFPGAMHAHPVTALVLVLSLCWLCVLVLSPLLGIDRGRISSTAGLRGNHRAMMLVAMLAGATVGATPLGASGMMFLGTSLLYDMPLQHHLVLSVLVEALAGWSASLFTWLAGTPFDTSAVVLVSMGGVVGSYVCLGALPQPPYQLLFQLAAVSWVAMTAASELVRRKSQHIPYSWRIERVRHRTRGELVLTGLAGASISALTGSGSGMFTYSMLLLFWRVDERSAAPTGVIINFINAVFSLMFLLLSGTLANVLSNETTRDIAADIAPIALYFGAIGSLFLRKAQALQICLLLVVSQVLALLVFTASLSSQLSLRLSVVYFFGMLVTYFLVGVGGNVRSAGLSLQFQADRAGEDPAS